VRLYLAHQRTVLPWSIEKLLATGLPQISRSRDLFIGDSETGLARRQPLLCSSFKCATHPRLPSQVNHNPLQSKLLRFCIHCLGRVYQTFIARFTQLRQPHFIAIFSSRVSQNKASFLQGKRDTAHQSQSQLAFLSIEFRIAADCALDLFFCLVLLILTVRSATSSSPPHTQSRCLPDSISLSTRSYPLNDDLPVVAEADVFIALRPPLPRQPVVLRKTPSMPRVLSRIFLRDRRAQVVKARF